MSDKETLLIQAKTHQEIGNHFEAITCLEKILQNEPGDYETLLMKADISRFIYPSFSGSNGEYIASPCLDRISP